MTSLRPTSATPTSRVLPWIAGLLLLPVLAGCGDELHEGRQAGPCAHMRRDQSERDEMRFGDVGKRAPAQ